MAETRYLPYGEERWTSGGAVSDYTFTGQRAERDLGLMDYQARYYDPRLGRFVSADTVVPEPSNPQSLKRYSYVNNSPLRSNDPTGHSSPVPPCAICRVKIDTSNWSDLAKGLAVPLSFVTGFHADREQNLITGPTEQEWMESSLTNMVTPIGMVSMPVEKAGNRAIQEGLGFVVRQARSDADITQSVLDNILPELFNPRARFGKAFYVSQEGETAIAEIAAHGNQASHVIRYQLDLSNAKVLDLANPEVAKAWGYVADASAYEAHQSLAQRAIEQGYNAIKYESYQGPGPNYALLDNPNNPFNFNEWLVPQMVSPAP